MQSIIKDYLLFLLALIALTIYLPVAVCVPFAPAVFIGILTTEYSKYYLWLMIPYFIFFPILCYPLGLLFYTGEKTKCNQ